MSSGVITRGFEGGWESGEDAGGIVEHGRGLAVHETPCANDGAAVDMADALMTETDAEDGELRADLGDDFVGDTGFLGRAGAGRDDDGLGLERLDFGERDFVVALHAPVPRPVRQALDEGCSVKES